jgi:hypothetical protein
MCLYLPEVILPLEPTKGFYFSTTPRNPNPPITAELGAGRILAAAAIYVRSAFIIHYLLASGNASAPSARTACGQFDVRRSARAALREQQSKAVLC